MKFKKNWAILSITCVILGIFILLQVKMKLPQYVPTTLKSLKHDMDTLISINDEIVKLESEIEILKDRITDLEEIGDNDEALMLKYEEELMNRKIVAGFVDVQGPGVEVILQDNLKEREAGFDPNLDVIHEFDVLKIIYDLNLAGAEVISINGERYMATSEIQCGGPLIRINGNSIATPIVIRAIGNPTFLSSALNAPGTYAQTLKDFGFGVEVRSEDDMIIEGYKGDFVFRFAVSREESE